MEKFEFILDFEKPLRDLDKQLRALESVSRKNKVDVQVEIVSILGKIEQTKKRSTKT